jgi:hypothetical protein
MRGTATLTRDSIQVDASARTASAFALALRSSWARATAGAALGATALDALLLQRKKSLFAGTFLVAEQIGTLGHTIAFLAGSLLADAGVLGVVAALAFWSCRRARLSVTWTRGVAAGLAFGSVALADAVAYKLASYFGTAFDLGLMLQIAGSPAQMLGVSLPHFPSLAVPALCLVLVATCLGWLLQRPARHATNGTRADAAYSWRWPASVFVLSVVGTSGLRLSSDVMDYSLRGKPTVQALDALVNLASDVDGDGYGILDAPPDLAPLRGDIRPYALDVPGNGVDEDGVGGDLPAGLPPYEEPRAAMPPWRYRPTFVMIGLESFRADALGSTFDGRAVTPTLDALARQGVSAVSAFSHNGFTVRSRHHLFSGSVAGLRGRTTLIDDFKAQGYEVAYFSAQDETFGGPAYAIGFDRADVAFDARSAPRDRYSTFATPASLQLPAGIVLERVRAFLRARRSERPLFLYVNLQDTHFPYRHPGVLPLLNRAELPQFAIRPDRAGELRAMYLNTVANVDRAIGVLLEDVRERTAGEPAVVVIGDHGESLFDGGFLGHGFALNDAQTQIPFVAAGLPIVVTEPFGQASLRDAVHRALKADDAASRRPVVRRDPGGAVFQYLGDLARPREIGLRGLEDRVVYDFRTGLVQIDGAAWRAPSNLRGADADRYLRLVRTWEQMMWARARSRSSTAPAH